MFGANIDRAIEVRVQTVTALAALEQGLRASVGSVNMTTRRATFRGVPRVDQLDSATNSFGLVGHERLHLRKRPGMQSPPLSLTALHASTDVGQALKNNRSSWSYSIHDLTRKNVVTVAAKSRLLSTSLPELPLGGLGSLALATSLLAEVTRFDILPLPLTQKLEVAGYGWTIHPEINSDGLAVRIDLGSGKINNNVKPPAICLVDQVGGANFTSGHRFEVVWQCEQNAHLTGCRGESGGSSRPVHFEGVDVVTRWTGVGAWTAYGAALSLQSQRGLDGFGGLHAGLNVKIADQKRESCLKFAVGKVVQRDAVLFSSIPTYTAHVVECLSEEIGRVLQGDILLRGRVELESDRSLHV